MKKKSLKFDEIIRKMETLINIWSQRKMSLKGQVKYIKILYHITERNSCNLY